MTRAEIGACCHVAPRHVKRSIKALVAKGLVEQRRLSAGRVYQYRLLHAEFGGQSNPQPQSSETSVETPLAIPAPLAMPVCAQCHLPRRRLHRSGICRGCRTWRCAWNWGQTDRKSTRLNSSHLVISYAVFCLKKK